MAAWEKTAFDAKSVGSALQALMGAGDFSESADIKIRAPNIAENGAVVTITVSSSLSGIEGITIFAKENPTPLIAHFKLDGSIPGYLSTRAKLAKTTDVIAVLSVAGKRIAAKKAVKVTKGGCGG